MTGSAVFGGSEVSKWRRCCSLSGLPFDCSRSSDTVIDVWLVSFFFGEVADDEIKLVEVVAAEGFVAVAGDHGLAAQAAKRVFEYGTQLIVVVDDENPTFLHPTPICRDS